MTGESPTANGPEFQRLTTGDLDLLDAAFGLGTYFETLLNDQQAGRADVLIGWLAGLPVAHGYLWLSTEPETPHHITAHRLVRELLPGTPFLQSLHVAERFRGRRIGTGLVSALEDAAIERHHHMVALGAEPGNSPARRLYLRLGYRDWPNGTIDNTYQGIDDNGLAQTITETSIIMTKRTASQAAGGL